jgi:hypothetical protein
MHRFASIRARALLLIALLLPAAAMATEPVPARLVVDASGGADPATILAQLRGAFGERFEARFVQVDQAVDYGFGPWHVTPPATLQQCSAAPLSDAELTAELATVEAQMLALEYGDAQARLTSLESRLCAATDPLDRAQAARVPFLLGICRFYAGDENSARATFLRAVERNPDLYWDEDFPPGPQQVFHRAVSDALHSPRTELQLVDGDRPTRLWVNGDDINASRLSVTLLGPNHLLQLDRGDGVVATVMLQTSEADAVTLMGPVRARAGLLEEPQTENGRLAFGQLVVAAHRQGHAEVLVLQSATPEIAWRYNDVERQWSKVSLVLGQRVTQARRFRTTGGVLLGVGAAMALSGAAIGATSHTAGQDLLDEIEGDAGMYDLLIDEYENRRRGTTAGFTMVGVGAVLAGVGLPLLIHGDRIERAARNDARLSLHASPDSLYVGVSSRF